jgi:hypothetical protein
MEKDWDARFGNRPPAAKPKLPARVAIACGYWALTMVAFLVPQFSGFDMIGAGSIPVAILTLPSSLLMFAAQPTLRLDAARPYHDSLVTSLGIFVLLPLISGGLNTFLIFAALSAIKRRQHRKA